MLIRKKQSLSDRKQKFKLINLKESNDETLGLISVLKLDPNFKEGAKWAVLNEEDSLPIQYFQEDKDLFNDYTSFEMFGKEYRSHFSYWFAHWCAFQMTALNLGMWKPKYLFHDIEKPWRLLLSKDYSLVQRLHRERHNHHTEYALTYGWDKMDWEAAVIDWECSRFTKREAQMNARETLEWLVEKEKWAPYEDIIRQGVEPILNKHCL